MAAGDRRTCGVHAFRFSAKQRLHLAALLICFAALPLFAQSNGNGIEFDPTITQEEFEQFSRLVAQGIYATPVEPARARGLLGFDVGVAVNAIPVDTDAAYWTRSVDDDFTVSDHVAVPRLVVSKGLSFGTISGSYAKIQDTDIRILGGSFDLPITRGGIATPTLAVRGAYSQLQGIDEFDLKTYGVELFLSKGFGPITPYGAAGWVKSDAEGRIDVSGTTQTLTDDASGSRFTVGVRLSLLLPKIAVEATQGEETSYAAKVSFGF